MLRNLFRILTGLLTWQQQPYTQTLEKIVQLDKTGDWKLRFELFWKSWKSQKTTHH